MNILRANLVSRLTYAGLYCLRRNLNSLQISVLRGVNKSFVIFSRKFSIYRKPKRSAFTPGKLDSKLDSLVTAGPNLYVLLVLGWRHRVLKYVCKGHFAPCSARSNVGHHTLYITDPSGQVLHLP